jgi:hypothetical protein
MEVVSLPPYGVVSDGLSGAAVKLYASTEEVFGKGVCAGNHSSVSMLQKRFDLSMRFKKVART